MLFSLNAIAAAAPERRRFIAAPLAALALRPFAAGAAAQAEELVVRYLGWAGVELRYGSNAVFIDPQLVFRDRPARKVATAPIESPASSRFALLTHLHPDHFDPVALKQALSDDGNVFAEASMAAAVAAKGLAVTALAMWEPFSAGGFDGHDFLVVPVPAADGFGDAQVSWVVRAAGRRFIHCGDTIWHGHWRRIGRAYGPFDIAFLPINGFAQTDLVPSTTVPYAMTPELALQAARLLGAAIVVPIHFGRAPTATYVETDAPERRFVDEAKRLEQTVRVLRAGDELRLAAIA
ncbi:MAG: MBL fold metallo-hydrolase [Rhizobacter sp.]|nr:MBL fold metallo-hydrolase [Rhizobacter sp.]